MYTVYICICSASAESRPR